MSKEKEITDNKEVRRRFTIRKDLILKEENDVRIIMNVDPDNAELTTGSDERELLYEGTFNELIKKENYVDLLRLWLNCLYVHWMDYTIGMNDILDIDTSMKSALETLEIGPDQKFYVVQMLPDRPLRRIIINEAEGIVLMEAWSYQHIQQLKNTVLSHEEYLYGEAVRNFPEKKLEKWLSGGSLQETFLEFVNELGKPRFAVVLKVN